jgi:hypothetical protein
MIGREHIGRAKKTSLCGHHRAQEPQDGDPKRDRENTTIEVESVGHDPHRVSEDRGAIFFDKFDRLLLFGGFRDALRRGRGRGKGERERKRKRRSGGGFIHVRATLRALDVVPSLGRLSGLPPWFPRGTRLRRDELRFRTPLSPA